MSSLSIELLNHASLIIRYGDFSLVTDPWYSGTAFKGGWGLRFQNPEALERAASCKYLWISHMHGDHMHALTLKALSAKNPGVKVIANQSYNYDMEEILKKFTTFSSFIPLKERKSIELDGFELTRFPSSGQDNLLLLKLDGKTVLNLNDCNLPLTALHSLKKKIGQVDILLMNYNHAGKILEDASIDFIKRVHRERVIKVSEILEPKYVIPFASLHYYRSSWSEDQNRSLLDVEELETCPQVLPLQVGMKGTFEDLEPKINREVRSTKTVLDTKEKEPSVDFETLTSLANTFRKKLRNEFLGLGFLFPPLHIGISDLDQNLRLSLIRKPKKVAGRVHLTTSSATLKAWFTGPFGTDAIVVGADFEKGELPINALNRWIFAGLLCDNRLSPLRAFLMPFLPSGLLFFFNRREEIFSILRLGKFQVAAIRDEATGES